MFNKFNNMSKNISKAILYTKNIALLLIAISLCLVIFNEAIDIIQIAFGTFKNGENYKIIVEEIILFFLYFEFLALIVKYFKNDYHFPLRYFIYIGITAVIRLIIVDHSDPRNVLMWGATILLLSCSLAIVNKFVKHD